MAAMTDETVLDDLDRRVVAALQTHGRATWQQIARAVGTSDTTAARRAQRLFGSGLVRVVASADPLRSVLGYPVLVQVTCRVGQAPRVAAELAARPDVRFAALITGTFDLIVELIVPSQRALARVLFEEIEQVDGILSTVTETVIAQHKVANVWAHGTLAPEAIATLESERGPIEQRDPKPLDDRDRALVGLLAEDARLSFAELAVRLDMSESMVKRRLDTLTHDGRVRYTTIVRPELLGYGVEVFYWLAVDLRHLDETAKALGERPEVRYLSSTAGYSDLTCEVVLRHHDDLLTFNTRVLGELPGIRRVEIGLELITVKRAFTLVEGGAL
ncbi:DNA-binding transcriptional regulator, Lrp family [Jiangella alkaliphila]|uniref:DNA-binding transcriptional regulator, Lrp family n=2 Tax=Jiangella alkaliphila TaxID=419479 RepID=A0A1H2I1N9_9ACTN|nr:DNA-binding transcriptional regulator, Lrp family [Jiangella alkaliphila]